MRNYEDFVIFWGVDILARSCYDARKDHKTSVHLIAHKLQDFITIDSQYQHLIENE